MDFPSNVLHKCISFPKRFQKFQQLFKFFSCYYLKFQKLKKRNFFSCLYILFFMVLLNPSITSFACKVGIFEKMLVLIDFFLRDVIYNVKVHSV